MDRDVHPIAELTDDLSLVLVADRTLGGGCEILDGVVLHLHRVDLDDPDTMAAGTHGAHLGDAATGVAGPGDDRQVDRLLERAVLQVVQPPARPPELVVAARHHMALRGERRLHGDGVVRVVGHEEDSHGRI